VPEPAVEVHELSRTFGSFRAVDRVAFSVAPGEVFGFLGPNGAGKSTTIRMLCGLLTPTSGSGRVAGLDIVRESERIKQTIGYMSQRFSLYEDLTVAENITFYGGIYAVEAARLKERKRWILDMAGLTGREDSLTGELSVGWKQRLALGTAVVHDPRILFLDEPTSGVDPISRRRFWDLIYEVAAQGVTVFVTTHYMDEAEHCDRLALIYRGRMIALGTAVDLKRDFAGNTLLEIAAHPLVEALDALQDVPGVHDAALYGDRLHVVVDDPADAEGRVSARLRDHGMSVEGISRITPTLEDVFVSLIERADRDAGGAR
jgi:ABC-2 type transport system ATP-binding protein